jgi:acyl carrier protein
MPKTSIHLSYARNTALVLALLGLASELNAQPAIRSLAVSPKAELTPIEVNTDTLSRIIAATASQYGVAADKLTAETTFESLGGDELDLVTVLVNLESQYDVDLVYKGKYEGKVNTLGDAANFVDQMVAEKTKSQ